MSPTAWPWGHEQHVWFAQRKWRGRRGMVDDAAAVLTAMVISALLVALVPMASAKPPAAATRAEYFRLVLEVRLSVEDVARVTEGAKDPLTGDKHIKVADLVRENVRPKAAELGTDPQNIGLPRFSSELKDFKRADKFYVGRMTVDFYLVRD